MKLFQNFLLLEEFTETRNVHERATVSEERSDDEAASSMTCGVIVRSIFSKWNIEDTLDVIKNVTFEIKDGECYGICGSVGDGKVSNLKIA